MRGIATITLSLLLAACASTYQPRKEDIQPEVSESWQQVAPVYAQNFMIVTPHPIATKAGYDILEKGGNAVDAAIAAQAMLTLVEPFASGIGGGGYMVVFDAKSGRVKAYDGREMAPASAHPTMFLKADGSPKAFEEALRGGQAVGVPSLVKLLDVVHEKYGVMPWKQLWIPTAQQALDGFPISERLHNLVKTDPYLRENERLHKYFYSQQGLPLPTGTNRPNRTLAETMLLIARDGSEGFYNSVTMQEVLDSVNNSPINPAVMTVMDIEGYSVKEYDALCVPYRQYKVCGMPPSSSGGIVVGQILQMLENYDLASLGAYSPEALHIIAEASRLAYADRDAYIADPAFVRYDQRVLLNPSYVKERAALIHPRRSARTVKAGVLPKKPEKLASVQQVEPESTSHISVIDRHGNAVSLTASIEHTFGAQLMAGGFLLNNQLTDFSFVPEVDGVPVANRAEAGKRPRSSMAPTIVFD
jgi:gamma-glutamyltranspeptidase/glutathione hydrolase